MGLSANDDAIERSAHGSTRRQPLDLSPFRSRPHLSLGVRRNDSEHGVLAQWQEAVIRLGTTKMTLSRRVEDQAAVRGLTGIRWTFSKVQLKHARVQMRFLRRRLTRMPLHARTNPAVSGQDQRTSSRPHRHPRRGPGRPVPGVARRRARPNPPPRSANVSNAPARSSSPAAITTRACPRA